MTTKTEVKLKTVELPITSTEILTLMFAWFKLNGELDWTWWWVLSPIWMMLFIVLLLQVIASFIDGLLSDVERK